MKKIILPFLFYVLFVSIVVFLLGFFLMEIPDVAQGVEFSYKLSNGLVLLLDIMPSICFTGFLLGCSLAFGDAASKATVRFSAVTSALFKQMIVIAVVLTLIISLSTLVFLPYQRSRQQGLKNLTVVLDEYITLSQKYLNEGSPEQAVSYIEHAKKLDPKNEKILALSRRAELELKELESKMSMQKSLSYAQTNLNAQKRLPAFFDESKMSVLDMLQKARNCLAERDFFGAHYFAESTMRLSAQDSEINSEAKSIADESWLRLQHVQKEEDTEGNIFFRKKLKGYSLLLEGKEVDAYYIFNELSQEDARKERDPDVVRYLDLAKNRLLENYFFIDETDDLTAFETVGNIYFTIQQGHGNYDVVLIRGITEVEGSGGLVRYLRDLKIYSFDAGGNLMHCLKTPYAKMSAVKVSTLDDTTRRIYANDPGIKMVPQIMLCSLGRSSNSERNAPEYFIPEGSKVRSFELSEKSDKIYWPMAYKDFSLIIESFFGQGNLTSVWKGKFASKAPAYGFSQEEFSFSALNKIFYPFMILVLLVFISIIAWNYRLGQGTLFKFKWIFILPMINVVFYFVRRAVEYLASIMNFIFIAIAGSSLALLAGIAFYLILLVAVIATFLARKGD